MAQFDKEIERLKHKIGDSRTKEIDRAAALQNLEKLMKLDGWEPGGLAERVDALEAQLKTFEAALKALAGRIGAIENPEKPPIGFGKS